MDDLHLTLLALFAAGVFVWLVLTWYFADDEPLFGSHSSRRVTFKAVVQGAMRDLRDVLKLDAAWRWLVTNACSLAVVLSGMVSLADPVLRQAVLTATWQGVPIGALALLIVTWLATLKPAAR